MFCELTERFFKIYNTMTLLKINILLAQFFNDVIDDYALRY